MLSKLAFTSSMEAKSSIEYSVIQSQSPDKCNQACESCITISEK